MTLELLSEKYQATIQELANDPDVSDTSSVDYPCTPEMVQHWVDQNRHPMPEELYFALLKDGQPVGGCALKHIHWDIKSAYLGYWIGKRFWGQGLGYQGGQLLRDHAFETLEMNLLHAMCLKASNNRSMRILEKIGFEPDSTREDHATRGRWAARFPEDAWGYFLLTRERWRLMREER